MGANGEPLFTQTNNLIYPYPVVDRSLALGSTVGAGESTTATSSALIFLNGTAYSMFGNNGYSWINSGNVGIGTNSPQGRLHVYEGDSGSDSNWYANAYMPLQIENDDYNYIYLRTPNNKSSGLIFADTDAAAGLSGFIEYSHATDNINFGTNGTASDMTLDNAGQLGIGDSTPDAPLDVVGDAYISDGLSLYETAVSDGTVEATKFCTGDGETNCVTDFSSLSSGASIWTDGGAYVYPTNGEVLGNSASAGANKIAGLYIADSSPLTFGTDNDIALSFSGTTLDITQGNNDVNFDSNTLFVDGSADRVGIGTATPAYTLDVLNNYATNGNSIQQVGAFRRMYSGGAGADGNGARLSLEAETETEGQAYGILRMEAKWIDATVGSLDGNVDFITYAANNSVTPLQIISRQTSAVADVVMNSGFVGIGTTTPSSRLHVVGSGSVGTVGASNLLTADGGFDASTGWTVGSGWTIGSSVATHATGQTANLSGTSTATSNTTVYQVNFTVAVTTAGSGFTVSLGGQNEGTSFSTAGSKTIYIKPSNGTGTLSFVPGSGGTFVGTVDSVTIYSVTASTPDATIVSSDGTTSNFELRAGGNGLYNTYGGLNAGKFTISGGTRNTALGANAGVYNSIGDDNTAIGSQALNSNVEGIQNTAVGSNALQYNIGTNQTAVGYNALQANTTGYGNTSVGAEALKSITSGLYSTAIGYLALGSATGNFNTGFGSHALRNTTTGVDNFSAGYMSGYYNQTGSYNTLVGNNAGSGASGNSFNYNTFVGFTAGGAVTTGSGNTLMGYRAGDNLTSGTNNIGIGYDIELPSATGNNQLTIGNLLYGTGLDGTGTTISTGSIGVGDPSPDHKLDVAGNIGLDANSYINFGDTDGTTGYGFRDNSGTIEFKNSSGTWTGIGSGTGGESYWRINNGALSPVNDTLDLLVGATATTSAKFAVLNVNNGTPTASVSGSIANAATFVDGNGNISTTNRRSMVLGNSTTYDSTGDILLNPAGGNVGIGTTAPTERLTINAGTGYNGSNPAAVSGLRIVSAGGYGDGVGFTTDSYNGFIYYTSDSSWIDGGSFGFATTHTNNSSDLKMVIENGGNVGIGNIDPVAQLHIGAGTDIAQGVSEGYSLLEVSNAGNTGITVRDSTNDIETELTSGWGAGWIGTKSNHPLYFETNNSNALMTLDTTGYLGIGTTSPLALLSVGANSFTTATGEADPFTMRFDNTYDNAGDVSANKIVLFEDADERYGFGISYQSLDILSGGKYRFFVGHSGSTQGTEALTILSNGNVGIGVPSPTSKLSIAGASSTISNTSGDIILDAASGFFDFSDDTLMNVNALGINDATPDYDLEVSAAAGSTPIFALSDPEVSHSYTSVVNADIFAALSTLSSTEGGAYLLGLTDTSATALQLAGAIGSANPTDTTPAVKITGNITTGDMAVDSTLGGTNADTVFQIANYDDTAGFTMLGNGNIGIGNIVRPVAKLHIISNPLSASYTTGRAALIIDQFENQDIMSASASGTTVFRLDRSGYAYAERFVDNGATTYFVDPGASGSTPSVNITGDIVSAANGSVTNTFAIKSSSNRNILVDAGTGDIILGAADGTGAEVCVSADGSSCTGKIDVATVDPPYTIEGQQYATYLTAMTGVKEETTGKVETSEYVAGVGYRSVIDFAAAPAGSDIWLFSRTSDLTNHIGELVVLLSTEGSTRAWYMIDPNSMKLAIYTSRPTTVSYRLTAPRFDASRWGNNREGGRNGLRISNEGRLNPTSSETPWVDPLADLTIEQVDGWSSLYRIRNAQGTVLEEAGSFARVMVANLRTGIAQGVQGLFERLTVTEKITAPVAEIPQLQTDEILPATDDSPGIAVTLGQSQTLSIVNKTGTPATTFDEVGNATFAGVLTSERLDTESASVAGELYAQRIVTSFGDLADRFSSVESSVATIAAIPEPVVYQSTFSAELEQAVAVTDGDLVVNTDLFVLGDSLLSDAVVTGSLIVGNMIRVTENIIETLSETLYIQKNKLASVDILDGTFIADIYNRIFIKGSVAVSGNTTVGGVLGAKTIAPLESSDLTIDLARPIPDHFATESGSPSSGFADLLIRGLNDRIVATIDASGSASFSGNLTIEGATKLLGPIQVSERSLGSSVAVGQNQYQLTISGFTLPDTEYSFFVTPSWETTAWVSQKATTSATINFSKRAPADGTVDWLLLLSTP